MTSSSPFNLTGISGRISNTVLQYHCYSGKYDFFRLLFLKGDAEAKARQKDASCLLSVAILRKSFLVRVFSDSPPGVWGIDVFHDLSQ